MQSIPFGQRVRELLDEQNKKIAWLIRKTDIDRGIMYNHILKADTYLNMNVIKLIANAMGLSIERLLQQDILDKINQYNDLLKQRNYDAASKMAESLLNLAVGRTERCDALNLLGRVKFEQKLLWEAEQLWVEAFQLIQETNDVNRKFNLYNNICATYIRLQSFEKLRYMIMGKEFDSLIKTCLDRGNYEHVARMKHLMAISSVKIGELETAIDLFIQAKLMYKLANLQSELGKVLNDLAQCYFDKKDYQSALICIQEAVEYFPYMAADMRVICAVAHSKILYVLGEKEKALKLINYYVSEFETLNSSLPLSKLFLLRAKISGNLQDVQKAFIHGQNSKEILSYASIEAMKITGIFEKNPELSGIVESVFPNFIYEGDF